MLSASRGVLLLACGAATLVLTAVPGLGVSLLPGWPTTGAGAWGSSPALGDLDGDGDLEVIAGGQGGGLYIWDHDGSLVAGGPQVPGPYNSSPTVGDLDGDGDAEIVVGAGAYVYVWSHDGTIAPGWPQETGSGIWASPALGDVDGDGDLEVVMGTQGGQVYLWHHTGTLAAGWPQSGGGEESSPALGDLDGDGDLEIVVGAYDGTVHAWHHDGTPVTGWPQGTGTEGCIEGPVTLGDLDGDGDLEVLVGSWDYQVHAWHHTGVVVAGWPRSTGYGIEGAPVLGDLDGDGDVEVVVGSGDSQVYAWHHNGIPVAGWPQSTGGFIGFPPALGDLNGDGKLEVVCGSDDDKVYAWHHNGTLVAGWPQLTSTWGGGVTSPVIGDLDRDGDVEVVANGGSIYAWTCDLPTSDLRPWPVFHHDPRHTGTYQVRADPWANFSADPLGGVVPRTVAFTDQSTGTPTAWSWDFGDGGVSTAQHPAHDYTSIGAYSVGLTVQNAGGSSTATKRQYILITFPDVPFDPAHWALRQVLACVGAEIVYGVGGNYLPEDPVNRVAMAVYAARAVAGGDGNVPAGPVTATFPDVDTLHWAFKYVEYAHDQNIVAGVAGYYLPDDPVTRGAMAVYVARAMKAPSGDIFIPDPTPPPTFPDVPESYWAWKWIEYCYDHGIVQGVGGSYLPEDVVTRDQMAVYVQRAFDLPM